MSISIQEEFKKTLPFLDEQVDLTSFSGKSLSGYFERFINSMTSEGAIPYLLNTKQRFRASPLASSIIWMEKAKLLSPEVSKQLNNKLVFLRDSAEPNDKKQGQTKKETNDEWAWSLSEGCSVWSTSLAIIALLQRDTIFIDSYKERINESIRWLIQQQDSNEHGWAYQDYKNCSVNSVTSSLAIYAIALSVSKKGALGINEEEEKNAHNSLTLGIGYLKTAFGKNHYCTFNDRPNYFATVWSLLALKLIVTIDANNAEAQDLLKKHLSPSLKYIIHSIPSKEIWGVEQIVKEAGAKYGSQKNYYSFSPTLIPFLLDLGVSPNTPKLVKQISLLLQNDKQWTIKEYSQDGICSFIYIMVLSTIVCWLRKVNCINSHILVDYSTKTITKKIQWFLWGCNNDSQEPIRFIRTNRIVIYIIVLSALLITYCFHSQLNALLTSIVSHLFGKDSDIYSWVYKNKDNVISGIISASILGGMVALLRRLPAFIHYAFKTFIRKK